MESRLFEEPLLLTGGKLTRECVPKSLYHPITKLLNTKSFKHYLSYSHKHFLAFYSTIVTPDSYLEKNHN